MTEASATRPGPQGFRPSLILPPGAFRLLLAVAVLVSHMSRLDIGRLAVLLFFFLSGYWTSRIWSEKFNNDQPIRFYISRYWRIAPLFLIATVLSSWLLHIGLRLENFTLLGVASSKNDPTGVSWSLDVELQFYLLLPFLAAALSRAPVMVLLASALLAVLGLWLNAQFEIVTVAKYLPVFLLGSLTYLKAWRPGRRAAHLSLAAFGAVTLVTMATPFIFSTDVDPFDQDIWAFIWLLPLLPYVAHSLTVRSTKLDRHFGNLSFPLYLIHYPAILIFAGAMGPGLVMKLTAVGVIAVLTVLSYMFIDRPIDALRVKVTEG